MKILVTCGPSYEPLDGARRLTNMSTGRLGVTLANHLAEAGHSLICFKGEGATYAGRVRVDREASFTTNDDLRSQLELLGRQEQIDVVLHAAALCDFRVERVQTTSGHSLVSRKLSTREGHLQLTLVPATKVLPQLRCWFPEARIVGWKYELSGTRDDAFGNAWRQLRECRSEACVLNGAAYGEGFALCHADGGVDECSDPAALCQRLEQWLVTAPSPLSREISDQSAHRVESLM